MGGLAYLFFSEVTAAETVALPASYAMLAIVCGVAVCALVLGAVVLQWRRNGRLCISTLVWGAVFAGVLAGLHQLCALHMVHCSVELYIACCAMAVAGGVACALRDIVFQALERLRERSRGAAAAVCIVRDVAVLLLAAVMSMFAVELPWNETMIPKDPSAVGLEVGIILFFLVLLYFLFVRRGIGPALGVAACLALGEAQYFVTQFRGSPMMPADLFALETAAAVSGGYAYILRPGAMLAIAWALGALVLLVFVGPTRIGGRGASRAAGSQEASRAMAGRHAQRSEDAPRGKHAKHARPAAQAPSPAGVAGAAQPARMAGDPRMAADPLAYAPHTAYAPQAAYAPQTPSLPYGPGASTTFGAMQPPQPTRSQVMRARFVRVAASWACAAALAFGGWMVFNKVDFKEDLGLEVNDWQPYMLYESFCMNGLLPSFVLETQEMRISMPDGYQAPQAQQDQEDLAKLGSSVLQNDPGYAQARSQFDAERPNVVVVMNETFSDLSIYENLHAGYNGPDYFKNRFADTLAKGPLSVSVIGGGTCNSELEFLANSTMQIVGYGVHPYAIYRMDDVPTVVDTFRDLGYGTTAMHPSARGNWHRDMTYQAFGFDRFVDIEDFPGAPTIRGYVTDAATYDKVIEVLKESDEPQFVFDVTIQNHGGYIEGEVPAEKRLTYQIPEPELQGANKEANEFVSLMAASDADLEYFIGQLQQLDEKVVLVFFGDHQPSMVDTFNETFFPHEDPESLSHGQRMFESLYAVWANYPVAGREGGFAGESRASASNLADIALQAVGGPLDEAALARLALRQDIPAANVFGYLGKDGQWYAWDDEESPYAQQARQLAELEYLNFGSRIG